jgi:uncharacterized protein involved in exopolysaccharide biosynthesis
LAPQATLKQLVRSRARRLRSAVVPEYESLVDEVRELRAQVGDLQGQVVTLTDDVHEARRLNLRVAQLTDLVTELVLPLHDRDIDPAVFDTLADDTQ